ncbi:MAG: dephospho-CoA kinase [Deltaproteobacteria bacterium]|nr:dephospho-CoA kinase [Deltaproteobacteria bacterium]
MEKQACENPEIADLHKRLSKDLGLPLTPTLSPKGEGNKDKKQLLIGLTGGIASGKSTITGYLKRKKIPVIDADLLAHAVIKKGKEAYRKTLAVFGEGILQKNGEIDRKKLGGMIFGDPAKKRILEAITHPEIFKSLQGEIQKKRKSKMVVIDAALLFESGLNREMAKNIVVTINPTVQLKRLMKRDKMGETEAWQRILSQLSSLEKARQADFVIDNSGTLKETYRQVEKIIENF